jgi:hypothetical protein
MRRKADDITGRTFGRLFVLRRDGDWTKWCTIQEAYLCRCICGKEKRVPRPLLLRGLTSSCGCLLDETRRRPRKHGLTRKDNMAPEYGIWNGMIQRCHGVGNRTKNYENVSVCERWRKSFAAFYADVGPRPSPLHSIDRYPNMNGDYEPGNCRWATASQQCRNRRNGLYDDGINLMDISETTGINYGTLVNRYRRGDRGSRLVRPIDETRRNKAARDRAQAHGGVNGF